jgi:hypothetical protein
MPRQEEDQRRSMVFDMAVCWDEHDVEGLCFVRNIISGRYCLRKLYFPNWSFDKPMSYLRCSLLTSLGKQRDL